MALSNKSRFQPFPPSLWHNRELHHHLILCLEATYYVTTEKVQRSVAVSYHVQLLRQLVAVFLHNRHLLLRACCLYCLLPFYQSILSSLRRSVTSTSSGAESSVEAFFFHFAKIIIFSEYLSFFCCFFLFFRSHDCRIRFHVCRIRSHGCRIRSHVCHIRFHVCRIRSHDCRIRCHYEICVRTSSKNTESL